MAPAHEPLSLLWSFAYWRAPKAIDRARAALDGVPVSVFADSGAFTAHSAGTAIALDDYTRWLTAHRDLVDEYCTLDVIGNAEATAENTRELQRQGFTPVPVFHRGAPWRYLDALLEAGHTRIALGNLVASATRPPYGWLARVFQRARGRVAFHAFGITNWQMLRAYPWRSADSSSWQAAPRFGQVKLFHTRRGVYEQFFIGPHVLAKKGGDAKRAAWQRSAALLVEHAALLRRAGFDVAHLIRQVGTFRPKGEDAERIAVAHALSYYDMQAHLRRRRGAWSDPPFSMIFAVSPSARDLRALARAWRLAHDVPVPTTTPEPVA